MLFWTIVAICLAVEAAGAFLWWQNNGLAVTHLEIRSPRLPAAWDGAVVVHLSDLHNKAFGVEQCRLLGQIRPLRPRLILATGDLIDKRRTTASTFAPAAEFLSGAARIAPTYFTAGNHEGTVSFYPLLRRAGEEGGAVCLDGKSLHLDGLALLGLPSPRLWNGDQERFCRELARLKDEAEGEFTLLLSHHPELAPLYGQAGLDLVFAGHAHGGQIAFPWWAVSLPRGRGSSPGTPPAPIPWRGTAGWW